jgi:hypothetical protein
MWLTRDKADLTNKKLKCEFKFLETSASSGPVVDDIATADAPVSSSVAKEQIVDQLVTLRKKYDDLVAFTVQLTAERDKLDAGLKSQKEETLRARNEAKAGGGVAKPGGGASMSDKEVAKAGGFAAVHLIIVGLIFFFVGKFL